MWKIPLIRPYITQEVKDRVCEVLDSGFLTEGKVTKEFEEVFSSYVGCRHAIAVTSCTAGLEIALRALGIGPGDEVIVPDYTYPATADVVAVAGAKIVVVDVSRKTMLIDYAKIEDAITERTKAIIPVSQFGNPLDYDALDEIRKRHGLYIVEDAACATGSEYKSLKVGNQADISVFSLHPRKFITTGEGGMMTTNQKELAEWIFSYKHFGMGLADSRRFANFERIGANFKLSDILAAVGLVQLRHVEELLERRIKLAQHYMELLKTQDNISIPEVTKGGKHSYQSFCILIEKRDRVMDRLRNRGIEVQIGTYALHLQTAFSSGEHCTYPGGVANSTYVFDRCLALPLYHGLREQEQEIVGEELVEAIREV